MEEKCLNTGNSIITLNAGCSSSVATPSISSSSTLATPPELQPSSSRSSMSLLQDEFANSQPDFAEVLDEETTTSGILETFEISSSNSLPTCSDVAPVEVGTDDSSSTDTIKLVEVSNPLSCNNEFFSTSEVFVINDDDEEEDVEPDPEDDDDDVVEEVKGDSVSRGNTLQTRAVARSSLNVHQPNGVIVTANGTTIYLETPVIEEQQHHSQISNISSEVEFAEKAGNPKRLSDEFQRAEDAEALVEVDDEVPSSMTTAKYKLGPRDLSAAGSPSNGRAGESGTDSQHDKMSFRLKKMHINTNSIAMPQTTRSSSATSLGDLPSSSQTVHIHSTPILAPTMAEIESMDLIERKDFETEQRLTGGILLKSSSMINKNMLNLSLIESYMPQQPQTQQQLSVCHANSGSSNDVTGVGGGTGRAVSSDSKCAYKDPATTPTSSRHYNSHSRLTKSTAKMNLCSTLSQPQQQQQEHLQIGSIGGGHTSKIHLQKPKAVSGSAPTLVSASTSTSTSIASVIVEAPPTAMSSASDVVVALFSSSNSNDSLTNGGTAATAATAKVMTTSKSCQQGVEPEYTQQEQHKEEQVEAQQHLLAFGQQEEQEEGGCSRTSALHSAPMATDNGTVTFDDAQPSTSSARCQYAPPPKNLRQVHASAQTVERYLSSRGGSFSSSSAGSDAGVNLSAATGTANVASSRNRRRMDSGTQLSRSGTSQETNAPFRGVHVSSEVIVFNEDPWADCEENNSDLEEICTCHHSSSSGSGSGSSHGGSNTSLNETDDLDTSTSVVTCGKDGDLSNYIQMVSISEEASAASLDFGSATFQSAVSAAANVQQQQQQRKRKYNESRLLESGDYGASVNSSGGNMGDANSRKRIAYDCASTPRSSQSMSTMALVATPTSQLTLSATGSPLGRRTPRSIIPTRDNPPPELPGWLMQFQRWSHAERLLAIDRLIAHCEPTQVRHMMKVIEPQFQRDFISLLPRELALQVLAYLEPKDLLRAAQTCRSWRFLCDDNLLWKEKCRKAQILTEPQTDRPKRGRAGNMPPIASPWKAAYMRQHIIEMNWRSRPIREPKVLKGHDDHVITCLQFSGNRIVSGSDDNTLKVWSAVTGRCLRTLVGHTGGVWSSQMSGNIIISGSTDRTLKVWDMETGQCVHTLLGHTSTVRCMHLHDNKVVSGSRDATLRVWDIELGTCLHVLVGHLAAVRCVQYDGKLIVSGAYDYMVKIWNPERQECLHTLQGHTNRVYSLQFDGLHVVSGSLDTSIRVWDVETGNCKHTLMGHQSLTSGMELRQNILVSGNADSTVKVWDITTGQCLQTLSGPNKHQSAVTCLQFNSRFVVTSSDDGTVKLWDVKTGDFIRNLVALDSGGSGGVVWRIRANDTKLICAVGSRNGTEETKLMVLDFDVEGACVKCS